MSLRFKPNDKVIHFTRYGGINIIEVDRVVKVNHYDMTRNLIYLEENIVTTNGVTIQTNGRDGELYIITNNTLQS